MEKNNKLKNNFFFEFYGLIKTISLWCFIFSILFLASFIAGIIIFKIESNQILNLEIIFISFYTILLDNIYITIPLFLGSIVFIFIIKKIPTP